MLAPGREERGVHFLHVEAAMGVGGVAGIAGSLGGGVMAPVAVTAAQPLVHPGRGAVIRRADLVVRGGGVALDADPLAGVA